MVHTHPSANLARQWSYFQLESSGFLCGFPVSWGHSNIQARGHRVSSCFLEVSERSALLLYDCNLTLFSIERHPPSPDTRPPGPPQVRIVLGGFFFVGKADN